MGHGLTRCSTSKGGAGQGVAVTRQNLLHHHPLYGVEVVERSRTVEPPRWSRPGTCQQHLLIKRVRVRRGIRLKQKSSMTDDA